jgi:hypothetical protein
LGYKALPPKVRLVLILPDLGVDLGLVLEVVGKGGINSREVKIELRRELVGSEASE